MKRLPEDQQKYEKSRQKAKWEVNDKKNFMIRKQVEKELILYESFRDCLGRFSLRTSVFTRDIATRPLKITTNFFFAVKKRPFGID